MPKSVRLKVKLLDFTPKALDIIYTACRQCYSPKSAHQILKEKVTKKEKEEFIKMIVASGHESPLEHVKFTFAIEGVSRVLTHQLVRHRLASYSQQSQRYVKEKDFDVIIPPTIKEDKVLKKKFTQTLKELQDCYNFIINRLKEKGIKGEKAYQDARYILPQAIETKIIVTMNCRELLHFFRLRCCQRAQWEIRELANKMLEICKKKLPAVFYKAGPKCEWLGYCPEGKFSCRRYPPKREEVKK